MTSPATFTTHLSEEQRSIAKRIILMTVFLDILSFGIIIPQLAVYASQFGASAALTGALTSVYSAMTFLFTPFWGRLSDRAGRRPVLLVSIFGTGLAHILFGLAGSLPWLFAARTLDGITGANISAAQAYLSDITEAKDRAKTFGIFGAIFGVGFAIGPLIGWALSHLPGVWGGNFGLGMVSAVLSFLNWGLALKFMPETLSPEIRATNRDSDADKKPAWLNVDAFRRALNTPRLNLVIWLGFISTAAFATMQGSYALLIMKEYARPAIQNQIKADPKGAGQRALDAQKNIEKSAPTVAAGEEGASHADSKDTTTPYAPEMGGDFKPQNLPAPPAGLTWRSVEKLLVRPEAARMVGEIFGVIGLLSLVIQGGLVRPLQKRFSEVTLVVSGTLIMAVGLALISLPLPLWWQFVTASILTLGNGLATPVLTSLATQFAPDAQRGEILGVYQSTQSLGRIIGPNIGANLFGAIAAGAPFIAGGALMLVAFFLAFQLSREAPASVSNPQAA